MLQELYNHLLILFFFSTDRSCIHQICYNVQVRNTIISFEQVCQLSAGGKAGSRRRRHCTSHLSKIMPWHYASRPTANICSGMGIAFGETSVALYQGSQTVALGRFEINILIKLIFILPFQNTKYPGLNSITRCEFYFHTKSLLYVQGVYLE